MSRHLWLEAHGGARRLPGVSLLLAALALLVYASPSLTNLLEWSDTTRGAWRLMTCHWTHFSGEHLFWDTLMFAVLGSIAELRSRRGMVLCVGGSALAIGLSVNTGLADLSAYRGLSGVDSALFVLVAVHELIRGLRSADHPTVACAIIGLVLFGGKTAFEIVTGGTLFVDVASLGVAPVPVAHAVGGAVGLLVVLFVALARGGGQRAVRNRPPAVLASGASHHSSVSSSWA